MSANIRNVIARYFEDDQDALDPTIDNLDFVEYLQKKNKESPGPSATGDSIYNPYSYTDPDSKAKDTADTEPFYKDVPSYPSFGKKRVFKEESPYDYWLKMRRQDESTPAQEQAPAISLDNRYASEVGNVIGEYLMTHGPCIQTTFNELEEFIKNEEPYNKTAATLSEIISKHQHKKHTISELDAKGVTVNWKKINNFENMKKGFVVFNARSPDSDETHKVYFQFLKDEEEDKVNPDKFKNYADLPVTLACTCESFLFYGAQWYALQGLYMYMPALRRAILPPISENSLSRVQRGKGLNFRVCKHILACYEIIKTWRVRTVFKTFMKYSPLSRIINPQQWKQSFGMEFTYNNIEDFLKKITRFFPPTARNFYRYKKETPEEKEALEALDVYFVEKWSKKSVGDKTNILKAYINHPEEIFYFLIREAMSRPGQISGKLIHDGIILIAKTIDPNYARVLLSGDLDAVPKSVPIEESEEKGAVKETKKGMPIVKPPEEEEEEETKGKPKKKPEKKALPESSRFEKKVKPSVKSVKPAIKPRFADEERTWREIQSEYNEKYGPNHHRLRLKCTKCSNETTCRCMTPKTLEKGICYYCTGELERPKPLNFDF